MSFFEWTDRVLTGDEDIDYQHRKLFDLANQLHENMNTGNDMRLFVEVLFDQLVDYTDYHFGTEESTMQKLNYPEFAAHKAMHDKLREQVLAFRAKFREGKAEINADLMSFLKDWLFNHIEKTDTKLAKYVTKNS